jgi:hypothetical protein
VIRALRRGGFALLSALNLAWGGWALGAPVHFFRAFPGFGRHWTSAYPPYNEHLVADLGATMLALGVLLGAAALLDRPVVSWVVAAGVGTFDLVHFGYHALHAGQMSEADRVLSQLSLVASVLLPPALAATHHRRGRQ